jgi:hypothetical protein
MRLGRCPTVLKGLMYAKGSNEKQLKHFWHNDPQTKVGMGPSRFPQGSSSHNNSVNR